MLTQWPSLPLASTVAGDPKDRQAEATCNLQSIAIQHLILHYDAVMNLMYRMSFALVSARELSLSLPMLYAVKGKEWVTRWYILYANLTRVCAVQLRGFMYCTVIFMICQCCIWYFMMIWLITTSSQISALAQSEAMSGSARVLNSGLFCICLPNERC